MTTRALLVIDVQNEYVTGGLPISYPPLDVSLPNIAAAMAAATAAGIPVVVVAQLGGPDSPIFTTGGFGIALHESVASRHADHHVDKALPSAFAGTDLAEWLTSRGIDTVTIVGYMTQNCDDSTARDAAHRGLAVEFLSDATGTLDFHNEAGTVTARTLHETVLVVMQSRFAAVASTSDWIAAVGAGTALDGSSIYASTR